jgi:hypothetical protein
MNGASAAQRAYWASAPGAAALPDLFTALQEQLGLKLNPTRLLLIYW